MSEVREEFDNGQGEFNDYSSLDVAQGAALSRQRHVDIRNFDNDPLTVTARMIHFDRNSLNDLNGTAMIDLEGSIEVFPGETWTNGTVQRDATRNHWRGITLTCSPGVNTTLSSI